MPGPVQGVGAGHHHLAPGGPGDRGQPGVRQFPGRRADGLGRGGSEGSDRRTAAGDGAEDAQCTVGQATPGGVEVGSDGFPGYGGLDGRRVDGGPGDRDDPGVGRVAPEQCEIPEGVHGRAERRVVVVDTEAARHRTDRHRAGIGPERGGGGQHEEVGPRQGAHRARCRRRQPQAGGEHAERGRWRGGHVRAQLAQSHQGVVGQAGQPGGEVGFTAGGVSGRGARGRHIRTSLVRSGRR